MFRTKRAPVDAGLELIDNYERAIVQAHLDRFAGEDAAVLERERAIVEPLAAQIGDALRLDYRSPQP